MSLFFLGNYKPSLKKPKNPESLPETHLFTAEKNGKQKRGKRLTLPHQTRNVKI